MTTTTSRPLAVVARSSAGIPRTFRLDRNGQGRDAAYRRLTAIILGLDVATLASELRARRTSAQSQRAA